MHLITKYHRPAGLDEAIALLQRPEVETAVIAGGTAFNPPPKASATEVVDIQAAVGRSIDRVGDRAVYEAMARIQDVVDADETPPLVAALARREGPNTLRNASTIGGAVAEADPESELLAALLVHEAEVTIARPDGTTTAPLPELLADGGMLEGGIIVSVSVAIGGETASARTGRTPADTSIVAAAGRIVGEGTHVAITGVAATPVLVDPANLDDLDPPADFRGTSEYRRQLATVLSKRVIDELGGAS